MQTESPPALVDWHRRSAADVAAALETTERGLTTAQAVERHAVYGPNELTERGTKRPITIIWEQLTAVMVVILIAAAALSLVLGKFLEAGAIAVIVALFTGLGFLQEYRAEQAIAALRRLAVPSVRVSRDGAVVEIPAAELVPGDVVVLEAGNVVPADLRIIDAAALRVQEAALTGESEPVEKGTEALDHDDLALGDRRNMAYAGTQVTNGRATAVVTAIGMQTELGRIAELLQSVTSETTPLQERLDRVGKQLAILGVAVAGIVVILGAIAGESFTSLVLTAISVTVAVVPEGLPAVVTFTLAVGAQRMLKRNALIRKLPAVETLGSVTVICSDKTGTLTQNRMTVTLVDVAGARVERAEIASTDDAGVALTLLGAALCNDTRLGVDESGEVALLGDPTETALVAAAQDAGIDIEALQRRAPRVAEAPFDSERKRMSTVHTIEPIGPGDGLGTAGAHHHAVLDALAEHERVVFVKGSVDGLLQHTTAVWDGGRSVPFSAEWSTRIDDANDVLAADGMRVLGLAFRGIAAEGLAAMSGREAEHLEQDLTFVGLLGIIDPPRAEARDAIATCVTAGIRVVMITGDHPLTATSIARDLGIDTSAPAVTGVRIDQLDDRELGDIVHRTSVFARVSPEHKLRIVRALRDRGEVVSMTGDGVNDAPALKQAHIGVAMGITGTDVSKEAANMVLRDDNFATIVAAVEEGRVIYDNLRRFVKFAVAGNVGKIIVMVGWPLLFMVRGVDLDEAIALLPLQLLWLNVMTDGLLGLSLGVEPAERNVMRRPPHAPGQSIWADKLGTQAVWSGGLIGLASLAVGFGYHEAGNAAWQSMIFMTVGVMQVFQALGSRSTFDSLRTIGFGTNRLLLALGGIVLALQLAAVATPLRGLLDLEPLRAVDLALCFAIGLGFLLVLEGEKWLRRRGVQPAAR